MTSSEDAPGVETRNDKEKRGDHSPAMRQFFREKARYPDAILLFRMGDFYELFYDDARQGAAALGLTLTSRSKSANGEAIPMAGVPHHAAASYIARLLQQGFKVALCEQMADPKTVKGIVPREVTRVLSPGMVLDDESLDAKSDATLASLARGDKGFSIASYDYARALPIRVVRECGDVEALHELAKLRPHELLVPKDFDARDVALLLPKCRIEIAVECDLPESLRIHVQDPASNKAIASLAHFVVRARPLATPPEFTVEYRSRRQSLGLSAAAIDSLELITRADGSHQGSLLHALDETCSALGARELRRRLLSPLLDRDEIRTRQDAVGRLVEAPLLRSEIRAALREIYDIERILSRIRDGYSSREDLVRLGLSLRHAVHALARAAEHGIQVFEPALAQAVQASFESIDGTIELDGESRTTIRYGAHHELEHAKRLRDSAQTVLEAMEAEERRASGIGTLKIRHTRVFGYYYEISKSNLHLAPKHFVRKQTVANGERFTTPALDELQDKIERAEETIDVLEAMVLRDLQKQLVAAEKSLQQLAVHVASLDVAQSLAEVAHRYDYVRPELLAHNCILDLNGSRHPTIERTLPAGSFVKNRIALTTDARLMIITGPNMAGKSTAMRQAALSIILAQMGSFVPAKSATMSIFDQVFTRIGASDNLTAGESTFMVEMKETADILARATESSFVVLDEVGRGTSTSDGLAIAWAVASYVAEKIRCLTMFATHYHELAGLADPDLGIVNKTIAIEEDKRGEIVLLHRLVDGASERSFGLQVAKRAGLPENVLQVAEEYLQTPRAAQAPIETVSAPQISEAERSVLARLKGLKAETTTPMEAIFMLEELSRMLRS